MKFLDGLNRDTCSVWEIDMPFQAILGNVFGVGLLVGLIGGS